MVGRPSQTPRTYPRDYTLLQNANSQMLLETNCKIYFRAAGVQGLVRALLVSEQLVLALAGAHISGAEVGSEAGWWKAGGSLVQPGRPSISCKSDMIAGRTMDAQSGTEDGLGLPPTPPHPQCLALKRDFQDTKQRSGN